MHVHNATDFAQFRASHSGSGASTIFADPRLPGLPTAPGGAVGPQQLRALQHGLFEAGGLPSGSPLKGAGADVGWPADFNGVPIPAHGASVGPFQ